MNLVFDEFKIGFSLIQFVQQITGLFQKIKKDKVLMLDNRSRLVFQYAFLKLSV